MSGPPSSGQLREQVWAGLMRARAAVYPLPVHGHNPNFRGAAQAAELLAGRLLAAGRLHPGDTVLSYPDYVLRPLRKRLLEAGVDVVVAAKYGAGYRLLRAGLAPPAASASIAGAERHGERIETLPPVRLAAIACVAVDPLGRWLGKGYGFRLPEGVGALPQVALVHPLQLVPMVAEAEGQLALIAFPGKVMNPAAPSDQAPVD